MFIYNVSNSIIINSKNSLSLSKLIVFILFKMDFKVIGHLKIPSNVLKHFLWQLKYIRTIEQL